MTEAAARKPKPKKDDPLGRLKSFGLSHPWQAAFLLPNGYDDLRDPITSWRDPRLANAGDTVFLRGRMNGMNTRIDKGAPRIVGYIMDGAGNKAGFVLFGDVKYGQKLLNENQADLCLSGEVSYLDGNLWIRNPSIVLPSWVGRVRPRYPSKVKVITPELALKKMMECFRLSDSIQKAKEFLSSELKMTDEEMLAFSRTRAPSMEVLLKKAHLPDTPEQGMRAQAGIERIAALGIARKALRERRSTGKTLTFGSLDAMLGTVPFKLTEEQKNASAGMIETFSKGKNNHVMLSGDVGTGKTVVYGAVLAAAMAAGMKVVVLLPNLPLAKQIFAELTQYWPQFAAMLVTDETKETDLSHVPLLVGTTALLFRDAGHRDIVVVDEQQKFARHQREALMSEGSMLIEATATCVPRTQALLQFGTVEVFRLRHCHVKKEIKTKIWDEGKKREMFAGVQKTLSDGGKVLVVYPKREASEDDDIPSEDAGPPLPSVEESFEQWNKAYPGRVRLAHGGLSNKEKIQAIDDLKLGHADIILCTSLIEVGVTIIGARHVVVVHAERFGLSTLHQIRGRVARDGGVGYCDLYLPRRVKEASFNRMLVMTRTTDGFELAREDMLQRGFGDLSASSDKQTGADDTFLFGRGLSADVLEQVMEEIGF